MMPVCFLAVQYRCDIVLHIVPVSVIQVLKSGTSLSGSESYHRIETFIRV